MSDLEILTCPPMGALDCSGCAEVVGPGDKYLTGIPGDCGYSILCMACCHHIALLLGTPIVECEHSMTVGVTFHEPR